MISRLTSPKARALSPYTPGEQPRGKKFIKLNTNENPYPPAPGVAACLSNYPAEELRLYPDPSSEELRRAISDWYGLSPEEVFVGNGSDEVLSFAFYSFFNPDHGPVLFPTHTYSFYPVYCSYYTLPFRKIPLAPDFSIDPEPYFSTKDYGGIALANPNAPTGIALKKNDIVDFLEKARDNRLLLLDEAYVDFGAESCSSLVRDYPNLLVIHTFSKSRSLAGIRVGFALGNPDLISTLFTVKDSFNSYPLDRLSQQAAVRAMEDRDYFDKTRKRIIITREKTSERLKKMGWEVLPSRANFIFARLPGTRGSRIYTLMREGGFLVRHFNHEGIDDFIRITIGTDEQMEAFTQAARRLFDVKREETHD